MLNRISTPLLAGVLLAVFFHCTAGVAGEPASDRLQFKTYSLTDMDRRYDGQWQGIHVGSDNRCYFGISNPSPEGGAGFFRYDPVSAELSVLSKNITKVCSEGPRGGVPQGKIHSPIVEHRQWLYFGTHLGYYSTEARNDFAGSHVVGYDMQKEVFRDFGILRPGYTIYSAVGLDPNRHVLYAIVVPMAESDIMTGGIYLYSVDILSGRKENLGQVKPGGTTMNACYWLYVDDRGRCWFTLKNENGALFCYEPEAGEITRFSGVLPDMLRGPVGKARRNQYHRSWTWAQGLPGAEQCLFSMGDMTWSPEVGSNIFNGGEWLWQFDPSRLMAGGPAFERRGYLGWHFLALDHDGDETVYMVQPELKAGSVAGIATRAFKRRGGNFDRALRLIKMGAGKERIDLGAIFDSEGRGARWIASIAADPEGRIYLVGDWEVLPGDTPTLRYNWKEDAWHPQNRSARFAVLSLGDF